MAMVDRIIGRCYACGGKLRSSQAVYVIDPAVTYRNGKPVRRMVHRDKCRDRVQTMFLRKGVEA